MRPNASTPYFPDVPIKIFEVDASAAFLPVHGTNHLHVLGLEPFLPSFHVLDVVDGQTEVLMERVLLGLILRGRLEQL